MKASFHITGSDTESFLFTSFFADYLGPFLLVVCGGLVIARQRSIVFLLDKLFFSPFFKERLALRGAITHISERVFFCHLTSQLCEDKVLTEIISVCELI